MENPTALRGFDSYEIKLGDELRGHRATLGKSLLDVQRDLRIKASYIDAIENCDASVIPNKGFVPGYIRAYARYLGLDAEEIYSRFCLESGFVGQTTRTAAPGAMPRGGFRLGGAAGAAEAKSLRPGRDPALARSHFATPVGRARPVGLGVSISDVASVLVLAALVAGLGYGGWALVEDIQRVDFAPSNDSPVVAEAPDNVALPGFGGDAPTISASLAWPGGDSAPERGAAWDPQREAALAELYAPREIAPPLVELRDGPIAAIDPQRAGLYPAPDHGDTPLSPATRLAEGAPMTGGDPLTVARNALSSGLDGLAAQAAPARGPQSPNMQTAGMAAGGATGVGPNVAGGALVASAGDPTLPASLRETGAAAAPVAAAGVWLVVTDPAWVQVKARDGSILVQRIMEAGESWQAPAGEPGAELRAGNAGGVWLQVDGVLHGPLGKPGEVVKRISLAPARIAQDWPTAGSAAAEAQRDASARN